MARQPFRIFGVGVRMRYRISGIEVRMDKQGVAHIEPHEKGYEQAIENPVFAQMLYHSGLMSGKITFFYITAKRADIIFNAIIYYLHQM